MTRVPRTVLVAVALIAAALVAPARAGLAPRALTVTGTETSYTTLRVDDPITLDFGDATVSRAGAYGGISLGTGLVLSTDDLPLAMREHGTPLTNVRNWTLYAGTYRVYLISDGSPVTVTLPWSGPPTRLRATTPVGHEVKIDHRTVADGTWRASVPFSAGANSLVDAFALYEAWDPQYHHVKVSTCVTRSATACVKSRIGCSLSGSLSLGGFGAGAGADLRDPRGWHVLGEVTGASPLAYLTIVAVRIETGPSPWIVYDDGPRRWTTTF